MEPKGRAASVVNVAAIRGDLERMRHCYQTAVPFPHIVIDDFAELDAAQQAAEELAGLSEGWTSYVHVNERKYAHGRPDQWGSALRAALAQLNGDEFVELLTELTGIPELLVDHELEGAGLHHSGRGGYLNIHADFTVHPKHRTWRRRLNLLWYLNPDWQSEWGGALELWSKDMKRCVQTIDPVFNRAVIFTTDADSFHGHPEPMQCPEDVRRQSLALYYFTQETAPLVRSTEYRPRPGDGWRAVPIFLDKTAVRVFDAVKRRSGTSDDRAGRLLQRLDKTRKRRG